MKKKKTAAKVDLRHLLLTRASIPHPFELPTPPLKHVQIKAAPAVPLDSYESAKWEEIVYKPATPENDPVTASGNAERELSNLLRLARTGNAKALWMFADVVCRGVDALNEIARTNPEAIKTYAKSFPVWPMMRSTAPQLCDDDSLLEQIELGMSTRFQLDKFSKWKPDFAAEVAAQLIRHLEFLRSEKIVGLDEGRRIFFLKALQPFSRDTAKAWWTFAQKSFLLAYPKPEEIDELDALVTGESKRRYVSTRRNAILEKIRARFVALGR
jgi:hypothetical protein